MPLKSKRQFCITTKKFSADQLLETLERHYPPNTVNVETKYVLNIVCDRSGFSENLVEEDIQKLLKNNGCSDAKVEFSKQIDLAPKVPKNIKIRYYIYEDHSEKIGRKYNTVVRILTEKQIKTTSCDIIEEYEIVNEMLKKAKFPSGNYCGGDYWFECSPSEVMKHLTKEKGFFRSKQQIHSLNF